MPIWDYPGYIYGPCRVTQGIHTTGSPSALVVTGAAHTTLTASVEAPDVVLDSARTVQFATGALTAQRAVKIMAPTYGFVGASTLSDAATLYVSDAPTAGTNATITRSYALWVDAGTSRFDGSMAIGRSTASARLHVEASSGADVVWATHSATTGYSDFVGTDTAASAKCAFGYGNSAVSDSTRVSRCFIWLGGVDFVVSDGASVLLRVNQSTGDVAIGKDTSSKLGLYGATGGAQDTGGQDVTNNVTDSGSTAGTIPDITDGTTYANDYTNLRRALYQIARMLKQDHDWLRSVGALT